MSPILSFRETETKVAASSSAWQSIKGIAPLGSCCQRKAHASGTALRWRIPAHRWKEDTIQSKQKRGHGCQQGFCCLNLLQFNVHFEPYKLIAFVMLSMCYSICQCSQWFQAFISNGKSAESQKQLIRYVEFVFLPTSEDTFEKEVSVQLFRSCHFSASSSETLVSELLQGGVTCAALGTSVRGTNFMLSIHITVRVYTYVCVSTYLYVHWHIPLTFQFYLVAYFSNPCNYLFFYYFSHTK